jgi:hypothetical protein
VKRALLAVGLLWLGACASTPQVPVLASEPKVRPLLPPSTLGQDRAMNQVVRTAMGAREFTFNCVVTVKDDVTTVVGLNAVGVRLFTLRHDGSQVQVEKSAGLPAAFDPAHMLADLQLVFWPLAPLQSRLREEGWKLGEPAPGTRRLLRGDRLVAEVHHAAEDAWTGRSWLVNFEYGYSLQIDSQAL